MASAALASRALRPPRRHYPPVPPPRAHPATTTAPRPCRSAAAVAASVRCLAVAADELSADPSFPEGEDRALSGVAERPEADVVVIGSGIGGLCSAGLLVLVRYSQDVLVLESHDRPGGAAHSFDIKGFNFDSGPSSFSGFQSRGPQVLDALGESVPCASYDYSSMVYVPEGQFLSRIGPTDFYKDLETYVGVDVVQEWKRLLKMDV